MLYPARIIKDYPAWQKLGKEQFQQLGPSVNERLTRHLGKNIGAYGVLGTMFYDIAHHGIPAPHAIRAEVARQSIWTGSALEVIDDTIDAKVPFCTPASVETFLDNCRDIMLEGKECDIVPGISEPKHQLACYAIAAFAHQSIHTQYPDTKEEIADILAHLKIPVMQQFNEKDPEELLKIAEQTSGYCTEAVVLSSEFVDKKTYPKTRQAAWHFGAMGGVLDHGSEILTDLKEGATTYLHTHGINERSLKAIRAIRKDAAEQQYAAGKALLETPEERAIYNLASTLLVARYAVKRTQENATPQRLEAALHT